jgi:hypothetical protein
MITEAERRAIEAATRRAFDRGLDFIVAVCREPAPAFDLFMERESPTTGAGLQRRCGAVTPGRNWGPEWTVYRRPKDWRRK